MIKHNNLIDPSREGQALVSLFIRNKRPLLAASVFASNSTQWILLLAAEVLNMYYASYTCPLCGSQISASSFPNYARTNRGYICYACKFCDFCQGRATTALNGSNCCDKCLHKLCREYNGIVPPPKLLAPSPYEHADQGTTRILINNKCYMLHNSVVLLSECNDTHHVDEASDCQMCRDICRFKFQHINNYLKNTCSNLTNLLQRLSIVFVTTAFAALLDVLNAFQTI